MMRTLAVLVLALALVGCARKAEPAAPDGGSRIDVEDSSIGQGDWEIEKVEVLPEDDGPKPGDLENVRLGVIFGSVTVFQNEEVKGLVRYTVDSHKLPMQADIWIDTDDMGAPELPEAVLPRKLKGMPPEQLLVIFRLEGDRLIIACGAPGSPRPTDFRPVAPKKGVPGKDGGGVFVVHLKKK